MQYEYKPKNVCARSMTFSLDNGVISNVHFNGGCGGYSKGTEKLLEGMKAEDAIARLSGINCGNKGTSCPAQFAEALKEAINN